MTWLVGATAAFGRVTRERERAPGDDCGGAGTTGASGLRCGPGSVPGAPERGERERERAAGSYGGADPGLGRRAPCGPRRLAGSPADGRAGAGGRSARRDVEGDQLRAGAGPA